MIKIKDIYLMEKTQKELIVEMITKLNYITKLNEDHEKRLRFLERLSFLGIGGLYILTIYFNFLKPINM
jgi:hypothetical protein